MKSRLNKPVHPLYPARRARGRDEAYSGPPTYSLFAPARLELDAFLPIRRAAHSAPRPNSSLAGHNVSIFAGVGRQRHQKGRNDMVKAATILGRTMLGGAVLLALSPTSPTRADFCD